MKPSTRIPLLLVLVAVAIAVSPAGASAQAGPAPTAPYVVEPIITTDRPARVSIGNGAIAWAVREPPFSGDDIASATTVWTVRDGKPAIAARLEKLDGWRLEAGTDAAGKPVAIVGGWPKKGAPAPFYLVRLDSGLVERLRLRPHARFTADVAIDAGRVLYVTTRRGRSSLWTARLDGRALSQPRRLRDSRRGVTFETVRADRHRIAVTGYQNLPSKPDNFDAHLPLYVGTARGTWRRIAHGAVSEGGVSEVDAAGFSANGRSVIMTRRARPQGVEHFTVERVGLRSGPGRKLKLKNPDPESSVEIGDAAYDPRTNRLLLSSYSSAGDYLLGWSSALGS